MRWRVLAESSQQLIALTDGTDISNNADPNIICNKIIQWLFAVHIKR